MKTLISQCLLVLLIACLIEINQPVLAQTLDTNEEQISRNSDELIPALPFDFFGRIAVLPAKNVGDPTHDWISITIQDVLTQDLWQIEAFEARSLRTFSSKFTTLCPGLELRCITKLDTSDLLHALSDQHLSHAISASYQRVEDQILITLRWHRMRESAETFDGENTLTISTSPSGLTDSLSLNLINWLRTRGIDVPEERTERIRRTKTHNEESLQHAAQAYWLQQLFQQNRDDVEIQQRWAEAAQLSVEADDQHAQAWTLLGWQRFNTGEVDSARDAFESAAELNAEHIDAINGLVFVQSDTQEGQQSKWKYAVRAVELNRSIPIYQDNARNSLYAVARYQHALYYAQYSLSLQTNIFGYDNIKTEEAWNYLGHVNLKIGRHIESTKYFKRRLNIWADEFGVNKIEIARIHNILGRIFSALKQQSEAIGHFENALAGC